MAFINDLLDNNKYTEAKKILICVRGVAEQLNQEAYAVGGLLRDILMNKNINDIDIMTVGDGIAFAKVLANKIGI